MKQVYKVSVGKYTYITKKQRNKKIRHKGKVIRW